ncbi:hypothetical protein, partial [Gluconacetobacter diazotrophicus]|uniref:hypothetical protein n=1 Tax=Gluconacetobacter diazotrophicus TaxID=33996 RepID=UPI001C7E5A1E
SHASRAAVSPRQLYLLSGPGDRQSTTTAQARLRLALSRFFLFPSSEFGFSESDAHSQPDRGDW